MLNIFWRQISPVDSDGQFSDRGPQYRSGIYTYSEEQNSLAIQTKEQYQTKLVAAGFSGITTEIITATEFYPAEEYHQQYLAKNPSGYCGLGGLGISIE